MENKILEQFSNKIDYDFPLNKKQNFKKKTGLAYANYELDITNENDLKVISKLYKENIPFIILGRNTNVYFTEKGYNGLIISISNKGKKELKIENNLLTASSNTLFSEIVNFSLNLGYDLIPFVGIPGMIGSAIYGNAGTNSTGRCIGKLVKDIKVYNFEKDSIEHFNPKENDDFFSDRCSFIKKENNKKPKYLILEVTFELNYIGKDEALKGKQERIDFRRQSDKEGFLMGTAGSFWANSSLPKELNDKKIKIRDLIKEFDLINKDVNGAGYTSISCFLYTKEETTDNDVAKLLSNTINKIEEKYNFKPINEVQIIDYDGVIDVYEFINRYI